jgi:tRNA pseudouridine55 synthase
VIEVNGVLLVNKPQCLTSRDVVNRVSKMLNTKQIGHTGTLDPLATGVLVLCVGSATKIVELITAYDKEYITGIKFGIETDTLDIEGNIVKEETVRDISFDEINDVLKTFIGQIKQEVPLYSAIKINGKRLYKYAREGIQIELPVHNIEVYDIKLLENNSMVDNDFMVKCHVSKGTYIRSLVHDIGKKLNTLATMSSLIRIKQGNFKLQDCYSLENIELGNYSLLSNREVLSNMDEIIIDEKTERHIRNGNIIDKIFNGEMAKILNVSGELLAIYKTSENDPTKIKPYKMFI